MRLRVAAARRAAPTLARPAAVREAPSAVFASGHPLYMRGQQRKIAARDASLLARLRLAPALLRTAGMSAVEQESAGPMDRPLDPRVHRARIARRVALAVGCVAGALAAFAALSKLIEPSL